MEEKKSWIVKCKVVRIVERITEECTEEDARDNPFGYSEDEVELEQTDWEVLSIQPNE